MDEYDTAVGARPFGAPPGDMPGSIRASAAARLASAAGDVCLVLDRDGTIVDLAISGPGLAAAGLADWIGARWTATATVESIPKIDEMMADAGAEVGPRWRQINQVARGAEIAVRYLAVGTGHGGRVIAIGRDMRAQATVQQRLIQAQQSLERDYMRLRQAESRYRLLFEQTADAVLVVDAATRRIREANPAAHRLLGVADAALVNQPAVAMVAAAAQEPFVAFLGAAAAADAVAPRLFMLAGDGGEAQVAATPFRQDRAAFLLVRLLPAEAAAAAPSAAADALLREMVERMPDAFVLTDGALRILSANAAYVELAQAPSTERVLGTPLGDRLGRPGIDLDLILAQLRDHGTVRNVATILRGLGGAQEEVEVSCVAALQAGEPCYGFGIRAVGRRLRDLPPERDLPRSVEQLTELVGRMSLKEIVRESTDLIERLCIEAALTYTSDNRASAAEILGVSRQSLYSKLHRHGLGNLVGGAD